MSLSERVVTLMMVFAVFGAVSGAVMGAMESQGVNWFPGASAPPIENSEILNKSEVDSISNEGVVGESTSFFSFSLGAINLILRAGYRVLSIKDLLETIFCIPDPVNPKVNLFSPFLTIFQVMIWLSYGIFLIEVKTKFKFS